MDMMTLDISESHPNAVLEDHIDIAQDFVDISILEIIDEDNSIVDISEVDDQDLEMICSVQPSPEKRNHSPSSFMILSTTNSNLKFIDE